MGPLIRRKLIVPCLALCLLVWAVPLAAATTGGLVSWIYDGDTLMVDGIGKVRLLGIDTPERDDSPRDAFYRERYRISAPRLRNIAARALAFNIRHVKGQRVVLDFDRERRDKFGRTLAYVYLPDGTLLNRLLLEQGLAAVYRRFDFRLKQEFLAVEAQARQAARGLWEP